VVTAVWLVVAAASRQGGARLVRVGGAGLLIGLAYLTRPEGLLTAVPLGAAVALLAVRDGQRGALARLRSALPVGVAFVVPLAVCIVPYAAYLHDHTGRWQLTAKTQDASIEAWHAVARGDRQARDRVLYALDDSGLRFSTERSSLPSLARHDPAGYAGIVGSNVLMLGKNVSGWWLLPLPVWFLAVLGAWRRRGSRAVALVVAVAAVPVATSLAFFVQPRYLIVTVALAAVLAGAAVPTLSARRRRPAVVGVAGLLAVASLAAFVGDGGWWHPGDHTDERRAGEWIAAHTAPDDRIMTRSFVVDYYAERPTVAVPYTDLDEILSFARHYGVRYVVANTSHVRTMRPQLGPLLERADIAGLRLVHEVRTEGRTTRIFALDPPPPPATEPGPSLGFVGDALA
jgi:hypothetical protein